MSPGRGLCDELITRPEESYRLCCVIVCDLETSRIGAPYIYIYDISNLRFNGSYILCHFEGRVELPDLYLIKYCCDDETKKRAERKGEDKLLVGKDERKCPHV